MRPYPENNTEDEMDLLMFRYMEKDLTAEEALAFEEKLVTDPALQVELDLWNESVIDDIEFFDTSVLEKELLQPKVELIDTTWSFHIFISIAVFFISAFSPIEVNSDADLDAKILSRAILVKAVQSASEVTETSISAAQSVTLARESANKPDKTILVEVYDRSIAVVEELEVRPFIEVQSLSENLPILEIKPVQSRKMLAPTILSKKQKRALAKFKEKALQDRRAKEFMKGNRPYVVPLDMSNF